MNQQRFDDSTLIRIFALHELHRLKEHGLTRGALLDYHSRYKLVFLAHSQPEYRKLGPFVADIHQWQNLDDFYNQYYQRVIVLLSHPANPRDHTNVLMHVQGYFRPHIDSTERQQLAALIDSYRRGEQPLLAPLMRIKHYMALYPDAWLSGQRCFARIYVCTIISHWLPPAAIRLHACWRYISLHHASGRRITCRRVRLNLSMLN